MSIVDGNALAGALSDVLGPDATTARLRCAGCGSAGYLAVTRVYRSPMGAVARCQGCDTVLVTVVETPTGRRVGFPGTRTAAIA